MKTRGEGGEVLLVVVDPAHAMLTVTGSGLGRRLTVGHVGRWCRRERSCLLQRVASIKELDIPTHSVSHAAAPPRSGRFDSIQVLRGVAAILVVIDHLIEDFGTHSATASRLTYLGYECGRFGVLIFFVISGFIMMKSAYKENDPRYTPIEFWYHRIIRVVPLYWICTAVAVLFLINRSGPWPSIGSIVASLFFLPLSLRFGVEMNPLLGQGWTLYYEMFFYLVFAACLALPRLWGSFVCMGIMVVLAMFGDRLSASVPTLCAGVVTFYTRYFIILFAIGMLIGLVEGRVWRFRIPTLASAMFISLLIAFALLQFVLGTIGSELPTSIEVTDFALATAIVFVAAFTRQLSATGLSHSLLRLGDASYSIYLTHNFALGILAKLLIEHLHLSLAVFFPLALGSALLAGLVTYRLVEIPVTRLTRLRTRAPR